MSPSTSVFMSSTDTLFVVSIAVVFIVYLVLAGLECYCAATLHPCRVVIIFVVLCFVGYVSYGNEFVSVATSQSTSSPPPECTPAQEPTSTASRPSRPKSKSKRRVKSEPKVEPESKSKRPEAANDPDHKPQQAASRPSPHPHFSPPVHRSGLFGLAPISLAPSHVIQYELASERRRWPPRARFDLPSHLSDIFAPKTRPSSRAPINAVVERSPTPTITPPSQPIPIQSAPEPATSQPPNPTPAQALAGRARPPSPSLTPLRDAKRQRTLSPTGPATLGSCKVQPDALSTPPLGLDDPALPPCPAPVSEHPGSPMLLDSPGSPTLSNSPGSPMLLDTPKPKVPSRPRSMPLPVSQYIHGPRVSIGEMIRLRIDFDDFSLSTLPPQDEVMRGPGMGDMDLDGAEAAGVFIEQDVEMMPRVVVEQDVEMAPRVLIEQDAVMDVLEHDAVMGC